MIPVISIQQTFTPSSLTISATVTNSVGQTHGPTALAKLSSDSSTTIPSTTCTRDPGSTGGSSAPGKTEDHFHKFEVLKP